MTLQYICFCNYWVVKTVWILQNWTAPLSWGRRWSWRATSKHQLTVLSRVNATVHTVCRCGSAVYLLTGRTMLWMNVKRTTFSSTRINQTRLFGDLQKIHIPNISLSTRVETKQGFKHWAVKLLQDEKLCLKIHGQLSRSSGSVWVWHHAVDILWACAIFCAVVW